MRLFGFQYHHEIGLAGPSFTDPDFDPRNAHVLKIERPVLEHMVVNARLRTKDRFVVKTGTMANNHLKLTDCSQLLTHDHYAKTPGVRPHYFTGLRLVRQGDLDLPEDSYISKMHEEIFPRSGLPIAW